MNTTLKINDLKLPASLIDAIRTGRWRTPENKESWHSLFGSSEIGHAMLYGIDLMVKENANWLKIGTIPAYLGRRNETYIPGDIDPRNSLLLGDLGPDVLIALDYRQSQSCPIVVYLKPSIIPTWIKVASDIETFMNAINL